MDESIQRLTHNLRNDVRRLLKASEREERRLFVAEGIHLCEELAASDVMPEFVVMRSDADALTRSLALQFENGGAELFLCSPSEMERITDAASPQSILAIVPFLEEREIGTRVIALDAVSDPGNVGTIIRCAKWFGFTDAVLSKGCADLYNPKTMRATAGSAFHMNVKRHADLRSTLSSLKIPIIGSQPSKGKAPSLLHGMNELCIVVGSEAHGVSSEILELCTHIVTIPGGGDVESLNAAIAAALLCYEARLDA